MIFKLVVKGIVHNGKARFVCAALGIALAVGTLVFMTSLVATNNAQAPAAAKKACAPWAAWQIEGIQVGFGRGMRPPPPGGARPPVDAASSPRQNKDRGFPLERGGDAASTGERGGDAASTEGMRRETSGERPRDFASRGERPRDFASRGERPRDFASRGERPRDFAPRGERPRDFASRASRLSPSPAPDLSLSVVQTTVDYRPGGHVLQGPPMMALIATAPAENPYGAVKLVAGRWVNPESDEPEIVCVKKSMRRFGKSAPELGEPLKFVGKSGTMTAKIVGYLDGDKLPAQFPYVFANESAFAGLKAEEHGTVRFWKTLDKGVRRETRDARPPEGVRRETRDARGLSSHVSSPHDLSSHDSRLAPSPAPKLLTATSPEVVASFKADEQKRMDFATPLLLAAAFLTALTLLINSLLLSVEAKRMMLATLRVLGLTRSGVVGFVITEALISSVVGWIVGVLGAAGALAAWVAFDPAAFPAGMAMDFSRVRLTLVVLPIIVVLAVLFTLRPALKVRPMDAATRRPVPRRRGMAITFGCGFAAFVAVEVWGASLMRAFVPSPEWPDAIVSILPGGVSSYDVEKLRTVEGVKRISELVPRQCFFPAPVDAIVPSASPGEGKSSSDASGTLASTRKPAPPFMGRANALFLAAEWLPKFNFIEGTWEEAAEALRSSDAVVITEMMMNAHKLHKGDKLTVEVSGRRGPPEKLSFPIAGVVDLNWHMVTSRGLVRGMNGSPGMTDGPVFCSLDTIGIIDPRTYIVEPAMSAPMTHLWVEYEPAFLAKHGVFPAGRLIEAEIAKRLGNPIGSTVRLHARDEIADGTLAHGSDIIGQAARVPFVFLAILAIGFVAMLVAEADARRREFVTLRAIGATKAQLAGRLALSAVRTALAGILVGVPVGSLVGWLFSLKTGNWPGLPHWFVLPADVVAEGALGALVFALVFAVPTAMILIRRK